jgi:predicted transcriptional regulator with HTH domain
MSIKISFPNGIIIECNSATEAREILSHMGKDELSRENKLSNPNFFPIQQPTQNRFEPKKKSPLSLTEKTKLYLQILEIIYSVSPQSIDSAEILRQINSDQKIILRNLKGWINLVSLKRFKIHVPMSDYLLSSSSQKRENGKRIEQTSWTAGPKLLSFIERLNKENLDPAKVK